MRTIVWFRGKDLRLTDHAPLRAAKSDEIIPLFVLDPFFFAPERAQELPHRIQYLLESLEELAASLDAIGGRLGDSNYYHEGGGSSGSRRGQWKPTMPLPAGTYQVYAWWSAYGNHATDVPYTVFHRYGQSTVKVNQRTNGGMWNYLGTFEFDGSTNGGYVEMWNKTSTGYVVADGVMFKKM